MNENGQGELLLGVLAPHPPLLIPEVGRSDIEKVAKTRRAMESMALAVQAVEPDVVMVISPHGPILPDGIGIWATNTLQGDFHRFGAPEVAFSMDNDLELLDVLLKEGESLSYTLRRVDESVLRAYRISPELDYATLVPLYYLQQIGIRTPILAMGMGFLPPRKLYQFGQVLRRAVERANRRGVVIASGDLSHRLTKDAPAGYSPSGKIFDETLWRLLSEKDIDGILNMDPRLLEEAGECGYRSLVMILGCWPEEEIATTPLSYEGPFGVGYGVCLVQSEKQPTEGLVFQEDSHEHPLAQLARNTVEAIARGEAVPEGGSVKLPRDLPARAGVFVSLRKAGELRGCIGTIVPTQRDLAREVIHVAREASTADPRFAPVGAQELVDITYSVDVLGEPELVEGIEELDPEAYGVIVEAGGRKGLLLPDLEGISSAEQQVAIARRKAGINADEPVQLYRFQVQRYH